MLEHSFLIVELSFFTDRCMDTQYLHILHIASGKFDAIFGQEDKQNERF